MSEPLEIDYLAPYIEGTITAATRFRRVLIVMITASVLSFGAFWNSWDWSWLNSRIEMTHRAQDYFDLQEKLIETENELNNLKKVAATKQVLEDELERKNILEDRKSHIENEINKLSNSKQWLDLKRIKNKGELQPFADKLEEARLNHILLIHIPFFGIVLDINDLGMLGGFTFVVILMWFRFSLWREYYNLRLTFKEAKSEHLEFCYKTLAMGQVLTVPPTLSRRQPPQKPLGKVVRSLYFLPLAVQLVIFIYDAYSYKYGWVISRFDTAVGIIVSFICLILSTFLTLECFQLSRKIDKKWNDTAKRIKRLRLKQHLNQITDVAETAPKISMQQSP